eukprot:GDKJ01028029.1.p1 GENE.GDKJ01028029.1~~GDKJ01028029.1.p1  ORF type:complete len:598 (+),score=135.46 GDKJ01028029.1:1-1794(+)
MGSECDAIRSALRDFEKAYGSLELKELGVRTFAVSHPLYIRIQCIKFYLSLIDGRKTDVFEALSDLLRPLRRLLAANSACDMGADGEQFAVEDAAQIHDETRFWGIPAMHAMSPLPSLTPSPFDSAPSPPLTVFERLSAFLSFAEASVALLRPQLSSSFSFNSSSGKQDKQTNRAKLIALSDRTASRVLSVAQSTCLTKLKTFKRTEHDGMTARTWGADSGSASQHVAFAWDREEDVSLAIAEGEEEEQEDERWGSEEGWSEEETVEETALAIEEQPLPQEFQVLAKLREYPLAKPDLLFKQILALMQDFPSVCDRSQWTLPSACAKNFVAWSRDASCAPFKRKDGLSDYDWRDQLLSKAFEPVAAQGGALHDFMSRMNALLVNKVFKLCHFNRDTFGSSSSSRLEVDVTRVAWEVNPSVDGFQLSLRDGKDAGFHTFDEYFSKRYDIADVMELNRVHFQGLMVAVGSHVKAKKRDATQLSAARSYFSACYPFLQDASRMRWRSLYLDLLLNRECLCPNCERFTPNGQEDEETASLRQHARVVQRGCIKETHNSSKHYFSHDAFNPANPPNSAESAALYVESLYPLALLVAEESGWD